MRHFLIIFKHCGERYLRPSNCLNQCNNGSSVATFSWQVSVEFCSIWDFCQWRLSKIYRSIGIISSLQILIIQIFVAQCEKILDLQSFRGIPSLQNRWDFSFWFWFSSSPFWQKIFFRFVLILQRNLRNVYKLVTKPCRRFRRTETIIGRFEG